MGVDFMNCNNCLEIMSDCGMYAYCEDCGYYLCEPCMEKFKLNSDMFSIEDAEDRQCPFCDKVVVTDSQLLEFALEKLGLTLEALTSEYQEN